MSPLHLPFSVNAEKVASSILASFIVSIFTFVLSVAFFFFFSFFNLSSAFSPYFPFRSPNISGKSQFILLTYPCLKFLGMGDGGGWLAFLPFIILEHEGRGGGSEIYQSGASGSARCGIMRVVKRGEKEG